MTATSTGCSSMESDISTVHDVCVAPAAATFNHCYENNRRARVLGGGGGGARSAERAWNGFELLAGEQLAANAALVEPLEDLER